MDFVIGALSLFSLGLNYLIYKKVSNLYTVPTIEENLDPIYICCCQNKDENPQEAPPTKTPVQAEYGAWKNQSNIPWASPSKPQIPIKTVEKGPLARPDGFI